MLSRFHRSVVSPRDRYFKIRNILNLLFILLVILTITLYFVYPLPDGLYVFFSSTALIIMAIKQEEKNTYRPSGRG